MHLSRTTRILLRAGTALTLAFLYVPLLVIALYAFNSRRTLKWPIPGLTLGDYITPQIVMAGHQFIGNVVYTNVGVANNLPLAAAFATVPVFVMLVYLLLARRAGAFSSL